MPETRPNTLHDNRAKNHRWMKRWLIKSTTLETGLLETFPRNERHRLELAFKFSSFVQKLPFENYHWMIYANAWPPKNPCSQNLTHIIQWMTTNDVHQPEDLGLPILAAICPTLFTPLPRSRGRLKPIGSLITPRTPPTIVLLSKSPGTRKGREGGG